MPFLCENTTRWYTVSNGQSRSFIVGVTMSVLPVIMLGNRNNNLNQILLSL